MAHVSNDLLADDIEAYLDQHEHKTHAAVHHLRQRRRRQVHADRPAALRLEAGVRGSPRRARGRLEEGRHPGRRARLRAAGRRPRRRARAGHHHRRRLPVLLHRAPQVHRGRHPGPRAVHAEHGHRRVHRRRRGDPHRRPQGRAHPDPPPQLPRVAARDPPRGGGHQQARPRRLLPGGVRRDRSRLPGLRRRDRPRRHHLHPAVRAARRQHHRAVAQHALVRRAHADRAPRVDRDRRRAATPDRSACRCSGSTAPTSTSVASPARSPADRCGPATGCGSCPSGASPPSSASSPKTATSTEAVAGQSVTITLDRRDRHLPRRRPRRGIGATGVGRPVRVPHRVDGRGRHAPRRALPDEDRHPHGHGARSPNPSTRSTSTRSSTPPPRPSSSTRSACATSASTSPSRSTPTPRTATSAGSSSSTGSPTPPSPPGCCTSRSGGPTTCTGRPSRSTSPLAPR